VALAGAGHFKVDSVWKEGEMLEGFQLPSLIVITKGTQDGTQSCLLKGQLSTGSVMPSNAVPFASCQNPVQDSTFAGWATSTSFAV